MEATDNEIRGITDDGSYRSANRYEQVVNFIYYFATNQITGETAVNNVNVEKIKSMEAQYEMEKVYVDENIKKGKIKKSQ